MFSCHKGNTVKKYREGNVTAAFGNDLITFGTTGVPNLLIKNYKLLNISDTEMMLLIHLFRLRSEENLLFPTPEILAKFIYGGLAQVKNDLQSLIEKNLIVITEFYDENSGEILEGYDFEPLFEKLSEVWACAKLKEIERTQKILEKNKRKEMLEKSEHETQQMSAWKDTRDLRMARLFNAFENEFGRPLSPMEIEQIRQWYWEMELPLILEALRRAVLRGKYNFKYIDRILLEWKKNNLRTIEDVLENDEYFHKSKRIHAKNKIPKAERESKERNKKQEEKKREIIKSLYLS